VVLDLIRCVEKRVLKVSSFQSSRSRTSKSKRFSLTFQSQDEKSSDGQEEVQHGPQERNRILDSGKICDTTL
jgi:hypothetical protein